jgi:uncharacterized protein with HEPN domain
MPHRIQAIRHDILTAIDEIRGFVAGRTLQELLADRGFQLILERIPSAHRIIGMRNILAHGYDRVDYRILWDAARLELESLRTHVKSL